MNIQALQKKPRPGDGAAAPDQPAQGLVSADPRESLEELFRDLRAAPGGLSSREAARRLEASGPNDGMSLGSVAATLLHHSPGPVGVVHRPVR